MLFLLIPLANAQTINDTLLTSNGLNTTINISTFTINFTEMFVCENAITFFNLTYIHPSSCNLQTSIYSLYNYTTPNITTLLPSISCGSLGGGGGLPTIINFTNITEEEFDCSWGYFRNTKYADLDLDNIKGCLNIFFESLGKKFWPTQWIAGIILAIISITIISKLYWRKKNEKKKSNK